MRKCFNCLLLSAVATLVVAGCSSDNTAQLVGDMNKSNIQRLGNLYAAHQNYQNGRGPKTEAEFKEFIKNFDANKLKMMGINSDDVESVFVSEKDGQVFKIRYNIGGGRGSKDPVIFETQGVNGMKQVAFTGGAVEDVDDSRYKQLWEGKTGSEPAASPTAGGKNAGRTSGPPPGAPTGPPKN